MARGPERSPRYAEIAVVSCIKALPAPLKSGPGRPVTVSRLGIMSSAERAQTLHPRPGHLQAAAPWSMDGQQARSLASGSQVCATLAVQ